jgi:hypothetical protein
MLQAVYVFTSLGVAGSSGCRFSSSCASFRLSTITWKASRLASSPGTRSTYEGWYVVTTQRPSWRPACPAESFSVTFAVRITDFSAVAPSATITSGCTWASSFSSQ